MRNKTPSLLDFVPLIHLLSHKIVGFDIDLAQEIGKILNKKVIIKDAEWQALLGGLKKWSL